MGHLLYYGEQGEVEDKGGEEEREAEKRGSSLNKYKKETRGEG